MTREEVIATVVDAFARSVNRPIGSDFDHDRDGPKIAALLRDQPEVTVAEYDPATHAINVTLTGEAVGLIDIMSDAVGHPLEVTGIVTEYDGGDGAKVEMVPMTVRPVRVR